jgi:60 kDa SS-A/Ro ribonucleoprotein
VRGRHAWTPAPQVVDALDAAFYAALGNVEPTGRRFLLALGVSGSMTWGGIGAAGAHASRGVRRDARRHGGHQPSYEVVGLHAGRGG